MTNFGVATYLLGLMCVGSKCGTPELCFKQLADGFATVEITEPVSAYVAHLDSVLPADGEHDWVEAEFKKIENDVDYPWEECYYYNIEFSLTVEEVLAKRKECSQLINKTLQEPEHDDDEALKELRKEARAHEIVGPRMKAANACTKFKPFREMAALPPCIQKFVDRAKAVHVPEVIRQFVLGARKERGKANYENLQRFRTKKLARECETFVQATRRLPNEPREGECPQDFDSEKMSKNRFERMSYAIGEDETHSMVMHARYVCHVLQTPGFGMEEKN